jgi:hypothetical protein
MTGKWLSRTPDDRHRIRAKFREWARSYIAVYGDLPRAVRNRYWSDAARLYSFDAHADRTHKCPPVTQEILDSFVYLWRENMTLALYGIPRELKHPGHFDAFPPEHRRDWVWLGTPGWYGDVDNREKNLIARYIARMESIGALPEYPNEWTDVREWDM